MDQIPRDLKPCRFCQQRVFFARTPEGKPYAFDPQFVPDGEYFIAAWDVENPEWGSGFYLCMGKVSDELPFEPDARFAIHTCKWTKERTLT